MKEVILVDDDASLCRFMERALINAGYLPISATTAETAWDMLQLMMPRALIVDVGLPGRSGLDLLRQCRADAALRGLPVMIITGGSVPADELIDAGCNAYTEKPFGADEIVGWLESLSASRD